MVLDLYLRNGHHVTDDQVRFVVGHDQDVTRQGYVVDRLKPVTRENHGERYVKFGVPVMQVAR